MKRGERRQTDRERKGEEKKKKKKKGPPRTGHVTFGLPCPGRHRVFRFLSAPFVASLLFIHPSIHPFIRPLFSFPLCPSSLEQLDLHLSPSLHSSPSCIVNNPSINLGQKNKNKNTEKTRARSSSKQTHIPPLSLPPLPFFFAHYRS